MSQPDCRIDSCRPHYCAADGCKGGVHRGWWSTKDRKSLACMRAAEKSIGVHVWGAKRLPGPVPESPSPQLPYQWEFRFERLFYPQIIADQYGRILYRCPHRHKTPEDAARCSTAAAFVRKLRAKILAGLAA